MSAILGNGSVTFGDGTIQSSNAVNSLKSSGFNYPVALMNTSQQNSAYRHAMVIMADGGVKGWGYDQTYNLGTGNTGTNRNFPADVGFPNDFPGAAQVFTCSNLVSFCIDVNGQLWSWGRNDYGSCGNGTASPLPFPQNVSLLSSGSIYGKTVTSVSTPCGTEGIDFVMVLCSDGTVHAAGYNGYGQCGDGTTTNRSYFVRCGSLTGVTALSCGRERYTACSAVAGGALYTWGYNGDAQVGQGNTTSNVYSPVQRGNSLAGKTVTAVGHNQLCAYALCSDGTLHGCGNQNYGQFGVGNRSQYSTYTQINTNVASFNASHYDYSICTVIKNDGTVYYAGYEGYIIPYTINTPYYTYDIYGSVTGGPYNSWSQSITNGWYQLTGMTGTPQKVIHYGTGSYNSIAVLMTSGVIYAYGYNGNGNLGVGLTWTNVPFGSDGSNGYQGPQKVKCDLAADIGCFGTSNIAVLMILTRKGMLKITGYPADMQIPMQQSVIYVPTTVPLN